MTTPLKIINRLLVCAFFATSISIPFASCDKEKTVDSNLPANQIEAAEKLVIPDAVALPANLPNGNVRVATFFASGVQKYRAEAIPGSNPVAYQWVFVAPQADLYDVTNKKVGTHSAG